MYAGTVALSPLFRGLGSEVRRRVAPSVALDRREGQAQSGNLCGTVRRHRTPPLLAATLVTLVYATVDIAAPLALSTLTPRAGWNDGPSVRNLAGIPILAAAAGTIVWSAASHAAEWRERDWRVLKLDPDHLLTPEYLVTDRPYRHSRNPLYLGDILMWAGWAVLLGSRAVAIGLAVLTLGLQAGVRLEERGLARQFGDQWKAYAATVPRFIGRRRDEEAR
jgi:protein-S-isoprenylcysteine O-methyltransferase Ste14